MKLFFTVLVTVVFCFSFVHQTSGQNLILNPGFENRNANTMGCQACMLPNGFSQVASVTTCNPDENDVMDWWDNGGTCDFYIRGGTGGAAVPIGTGSGFFTDAGSPQDVRTGDAAGGFIVHRVGGSNPHQREYLIAKLSSPLVVGQQYGVEFYALLSNNSTFSTDDIGAYFSNGVINNLAPPPSENALQIYNSSISFDVQATSTVDDVVNWTQICGVFTATTPATHVYFGNVNSFPNTTLTPRAQTGSSTWDGAYYYIDDVRVEPWTGTSANFCTSTLPVELIYFSGRATEGKNLLSWKTTEELEHDHFVMERLAGNQFYEIGSVPGKGGIEQSQDYEFEHPNPMEAESYRLKIVDTEGGFTYSKTILVKSQVSNDVQLEFFPNPSSGKLFLDVVGGANHVYQLAYSDWTGSTVRMEYIQLEEGRSIYEVEGLSELAAGLYFVKVASEKGQLMGYFKLIKH